MCIDQGFILIFPQIFYVAKLAITNKNILPIFCYRPDMKVENFKNPFYILATC